MTPLVWALCAGLFVAVELMTGSFYLLLLGIACAFGGIAALVEASTTVQLLVAGGSAIAMLALKLPTRLQQRLRSPEVQANDIGASVTVTRVENGQIRVSYRGSEWNATEVSSAPVAVGDTLRVIRVEGIGLVCRKA